MPEHSSTATRRFKPTWVTQLELDGPVGDLVVPPHTDAPNYARARVLVRLNRHPLGILDLALDDGRASADRVAAAVTRELAGPLAAHLEREELATAEPAPDEVPAASVPDRRSPAPASEREPFVSVVIATRERPSALATCLARLGELDYEHFEVIVVDNAPLTDSTAELVSSLDDSRVRYTVEPTAGASRARNTGAETARGDVIAFVDDDVLVDPHWLRALARGFKRNPEVACVTALVPAAELQTESQLMFDSRVSWGTDYVPRLYDIDHHALDDPLYPYIPGAIGTGASFAVHRKAFLALGGFDEALGPGRPSRGGEDLDFFLRLLLSRRCIAYEPAALCWHVHRRGAGALRAQLFGYGCGLGAYAFKQMLSPSTAIGVIRRIPRGLARLRKLEQRDGMQVARPRGLAMVEAAGLAAGPFAYLLSRRRVRRRHGGFKSGTPKVRRR